jgi:ABC-2 type transport system permease protein
VWRQLTVLLRKEFLQIGRDTVILRMLLVMPLIQLVVLANAATFEVRHTALWVVDQDRTPTATALVDRFRASGRFQVAGYGAGREPAEAALRAGRTDAVLVIPAEFDRTIRRDRRADVQLVFDAVNGAQAGIALGYASTILADFGTGLGATVGTPRRATTVDVRRQGRFNPTLDYHHYMVPGILVQLVTLIGTLMTALNIVREKEAGTLDQLNVTPLRPPVFLAAKLLPLWLIALGEFVVGMQIARVLFDVPIIGNPLVVLVGAGVFLTAALGVGLWVSTVAETQQQALFVTFALLMVYILMSGLFTPVRSMPDAVQAIARANPMLHFIALVRAVLLRGAGFADVARELAAMAAIGGVILALAVGQYRKQTA